MKITNSKPLGRKITTILESMLGRGGSAFKAKTSNLPKFSRQNKLFASWPSRADREISFVAGLDQHPVVNILILEQFIHKQANINERYYSFMANSLLNKSISDNNTAQIKKTAAIQNMVNIIKSSVSEMKAISIFNISTAKG